MKDRTVRDYHERTKHQVGRYARSLGYLDWATQPDPFRRFIGAEHHALIRPESEARPTWDELFRRPSDPADPAAVTSASIGRLFYFSLAISAWKELRAPDGSVASRWALRVNPSSGNLHPTEGYLIGPALFDEETPGCIYHYAPDEHRLERRGALPEPAWSALQAHLPPGGFLLGLASIHWREMWKYGERAFRYCQHDVGHALAALDLSAACLGWRTRLLSEVSAALADRILGTDRQSGPEQEHGDCLLLVDPHGPVPGAAEPGLAATLVQVADQATWFGRPNTLSPDHHDWPVIDQVAAAVRGDLQPPESATATDETAVPSPEPDRTDAPTDRMGSDPDRGVSAQALVRRRRSAQAMDGVTTLPRDDFYRLLRRLLPGDGRRPFTLLPRTTAVSLVIFVHRVDGLPSGLYVLVRDPAHEASLRLSLRPEAAWVRPDACPDGLPFYRLGDGDLRETARRLSCLQDIAADGVFSLAMLAHFTPTLDRRGPAMYPRLFWETGVVGQMLYLEAEAAGLRGTGIGCFFDDEVHRLLGQTDDTWQSLYHFTVGGALEDTRLQTAAAYPTDDET